MADNNGPSKWLNINFKRQSPSPFGKPNSELLIMMCHLRIHSRWPVIIMQKLFEDGAHVPVGYWLAYGKRGYSWKPFFPLEVNRYKNELPFTNVFSSQVDSDSNAF